MDKGLMTHEPHGGDVSLGTYAGHTNASEMPTVVLQAGEAA